MPMRTIAIALLFTSVTFAEQVQRQLVLLPEHVTLDGRQSFHRLLAEWQLDEDLVGPATDASWSSSDSDVVQVSDGVAEPVSDGTAEIRAEAQPTFDAFTAANFSF